MKKFSGAAKTALAAGMLSCVNVFGADYHWTGAAGNRLWSDPRNWETSTGAPVASVDAGNAHTYNFGRRNGVDAGWENGLVVKQDVDVILGASVELTPADDNAVSLEFESASGCKMSLSDTSFLLKRRSTLILSVDMSGDWGYGNVIKRFDGTLVWNLKAENKNTRNHFITGGRSVFSETGKAPLLGIRLATSKGVKEDEERPKIAATFENRCNGAQTQTLYIDKLDNGASSIGRVDLSGKAFCVGYSANSTTTNLMPMAVFGEGGALAVQNERRACLRGLPIGGTLAVNRADARVDTANTAIRWLFDDPDDPQRDDVGAGSRLLAPNGRPEIVTDETRGSVLSVSDGKYFKGPDANGGFKELQLQNGRNNPYTVAFWFKPAAGGDSKGKIFFWGDQTASRVAAGLRLNNSEQEGLMFTVWGDNHFIPTEASPRDGRWHHFAVVYNGLSAFNVYYDGKNVHNFTVGYKWTGSENVYDYQPENKNFYIGSIYGGWCWGGENPYTGFLDDFLIGTYALAQEEITSLYNNGLAATIPVGSVDVRSAGKIAFVKNTVNVKTLSGKALDGRLEMCADGSALNVGTEADAGGSEFKGKISGGATTLVKKGAGYALELSGEAVAVTNVVVKEGALLLRRPLARAGLVASYPFDDGNIGKDASPAGLDLSAVGTASDLTVVEGGVSGKALRFGGSANLASSTAFRPSHFPKGDSPFTVSVWIKPDEQACAKSVPIWSFGGSDTRLLSMLRFNDATGLNFTTWNGNVDDDIKPSDITLLDGKWHHVVATYDGTTKVLYFDGVKMGAKSGITLDIAESELQIGRCTMVDSRKNDYYRGDMDEFQILSVAWSEDEVKAEFNCATPCTVAAEKLLPAPVAHWTFDDDESPGADSSASALNLTQSGAVGLESGDSICGKAARFSPSSGFFKLSAFSDAIPSGTAAYTVVVRYRPDREQAGGYFPGIVMWGDAAGWEQGKLVKISLDKETGTSVRSTVSGHVFEPGYFRTDMGTEASRWLIAAYAYSPEHNFVRVYIDGELVAEATGKKGNLAAKDFSIGSNYSGGQNFYGLIDDVQIYDHALAPGQIRLVAEQLDAAKGSLKTASDAILTAVPDVMVLEGATLKVASDESIASLSGSGTVEIAPLASLMVANLNGFAGALSGIGTLAIAEGSILDFRDGSAPILSTAGTIAIGANVTVDFSGRPDFNVIFSAGGFTGIENLKSWRTTSNNAVFRVGDNGRSVKMCVSGFFISIR